MSLLTLITDKRYFLHDTGGEPHPEIPERVHVIRRSLETASFFADISIACPRMAEREWLLAAHNESWLFRFEEKVLSGKTYIDHVDNQIGYESFTIAMLAAGAGLTGIDLLESDGAKNVFCLVRPPGHHAEAGIPFGFCFFNNCVVAARYWQQEYNKKRILIFDFDAHHGNGIQSAFEEEADTFYISIHEHPSFSYPGTGYADDNGIGEGKGTILNLPLQPGASDKQVVELLENVIPKKLKEWRPDALIIAAGFDAHLVDDMSGLRFSTEIYSTIGKAIQSWAQQYTEGKILSILEGGYELSVLGESVEAYVNGLLGQR